MTFEDMDLDDESFERDLFARRAAVVPAPELDFEDVVARASGRPECVAHVRSAAWIGMAAALFVIVRGSSFALPDTAADLQIASEGESGFCAKPALALEEAACVDPSKMICEVTFGACRP